MTKDQELAKEYNCGFIDGMEWAVGGLLQQAGEQFMEGKDEAALALREIASIFKSQVKARKNGQENK